MVDLIDGLITVLFDHNARVDERDDAAMDLGDFDDKRALEALSAVASNSQEDEMILNSSAESIAQILVRKKEFKKDLIKGLVPMAQDIIMSYIKAGKPEWFQ